jgi:SAM-dependent methyltransferase
VSAYVYDYSGYYNFGWLKKFAIADSGTNLFLNINAGFDETSFIIKHLYPQSDLKVFDFYDAARHTEPAIIRARKVSLVYPDTRQMSTGSIPLPDNSADIIFLLSAAHEIRTQGEKIQFLKECHRVCKAGGQVIMVEHLRDFPNFLAFTVGFTHFFSRRTWRRAFEGAGFSSFAETKFTPFMSVFRCGY